MLLEQLRLLTDKYIHPITSLKAILVIIILGLVVYSNSLVNGFVIDDNGQILANSSIQSISSIPSIFLDNIRAQETSNYYRPLPFAFYTVLYALFEDSAMAFHFLQLVLHIGVSILFFLIIKPYVKSGLALVMALLFLVHPINQETVAYIANLQDVLFVLFGLLAMYLLQRDSNKPQLILFANGALLLSLFSKESGGLFVLICLLYVALFKREKLLYQTISSVVVVTVYMGVRYLADIQLQKSALLPMLNASLWERLISIPSVLFYYLSTLFFPYNLSVIHTWVIRSIQFQAFALPLIAVLLFFVALGFGVRFLYKQGKGQIALFFLIWFLLGLLLHIQIYPIGMTVADHYFYFSFIGLLALSALVINQLSLKGGTVHILLAVSVIVICVLSARTMVRNADWKDQSTLIIHDVQVEKDDYLLELLYSTDLLQQGKFDEALPHAEKATELYPQGWIAWNNVGVVYVQRDNYELASYAFEQSMARGDYYGSYENFALMKLRHQPLDEARGFIKDALEKFPNSEKLWYYRLLSSYKAEDYEDALYAAKQSNAIKQDLGSYQIIEYVQQKRQINITF